MTLIAMIPFLFAIVGVLVYMLASNGKVAEVGRITFFVGLLFVVAHLAGRVVHLP